MKPFTQITNQKPQLYYEFLEKVMNDQYQNSLVSNQASELIEGILRKLVMRKVDLEMEKVLTDSSYGDEIIPNTKAASHSRVVNITEKHEQILKMLAKFPGVSRRDLAQLLCWPINRVTPRCLELIELNKIAVVGTKYDATTDRHVQTLKVV